MDWFQTNPYGNSASWMKESRWDIHKFGRQQFVSNFARNGLSSTLFAATPGAAFRSVMGKTHEAGSRRHITNLELLLRQDPQNEKIQMALKQARAKTSKSTTGLGKLDSKIGSGTMKALSHVGSAAFYGLTFATTEGDIVSKSRATIAEMVGMQAFKPGAAVGAAVGTAILPVIGTAVGALVGGLGAQIGVSAGVNAIFDTTDRMVQRERDRRNLNWVGDMTAFNTQNAYTMRQQSLSAMNRGMATARSALGREAIMVHR